MLGRCLLATWFHLKREREIERERERERNTNTTQSQQNKQHPSSVAILVQASGIWGASMATFSKARLEGRALEHAFAGDPGGFVRMCDRHGVWHKVSAPSVKRAMEARAAAVLEELRGQGLHKKGADLAVKVDAKQTLSVDLLLYLAERGESAAVEVKWTRHRVTASIQAALSKLPDLKKACEKERWVRSRHAVKAAIVGALVVSPSAWWLHLESCTAATKFSCDLHSPPKAHEAMLVTKRCYSSGASKRKGSPNKQLTEKQWRKTAKGRSLQVRYRASVKGKLQRRRESACRTNPTSGSRKRPAAA